MREDQGLSVLTLFRKGGGTHLVQGSDAPSIAWVDAIRGDGNAPAPTKE